MDFIFVGAHPDDVEISSAGTILKLKSAGFDLLILDLTDGEPTPYGTPERRREEAKKAASVLGVQRRTLDLPNRYLFDTVSARKKVAEVIREYKPRTLFTHHGDDRHPDHWAARKITEAGRFYAKLTKTDIRGEPFYPKNLLFFYASHKKILVQPQFVVDVSDVFERKIECLKSYETQFILNPARKGFIERIRCMAEAYGRLIDAKYGEPIFIEEPLSVQNFSSFPF